MKQLRMNKVDETERFYRFRQETPKNFEPHSFRTIHIGRAEAVVGKHFGSKVMSVQSILLPKKKFNKNQAKAWIKHHY